MKAKDEKIKMRTTERIRGYLQKKRMWVIAILVIIFGAITDIIRGDDPLAVLIKDLFSPFF